MGKVRTILVTGSSGLVGSEAVLFFDEAGNRVIGVDNNMRADFFGPGGDTTSTLDYLRKHTGQFQHYDLDIRDRSAVLDLLKMHRPDAIVHCASQPSHDLAKDRVFDDFDVNAVGTLNLLEAARQFASEAPFVFLSINKVYGDAPNRIPLTELETRYEYAREEDYYGVSESCSIDQCLHSLFGASKAAADIVTQEFGRYFNMPTVCFRAGCITGVRHSGVKLHGFLNYLARVAARGESYEIIGYKGKQVRDQLDARDLVRAISLFIDNPRVGEVYNIGGGRESNASVVECIKLFEESLEVKMSTTQVSDARVGDHICYISDTRKFRMHYPTWEVEHPVEEIISLLCSSEL